MQFRIPIVNVSAQAQLEHLAHFARIIPARRTPQHAVEWHGVRDSAVGSSVAVSKVSFFSCVAVPP